MERNRMIQAVCPHRSEQPIHGKRRIQRRKKQKDAAASFCWDIEGLFSPAGSIENIYEECMFLKTHKCVILLLNSQKKL